jgi:hypothetical protein
MSESRCANTASPLAGHNLIRVQPSLLDWNNMHRVVIKTS